MNPNQAAAIQARRTGDHLVNKLTPGRCGSCRRPLLTGWVDGWPTRIDANVDLDYDLEIVAIDRGVRTFDVVRGGHWARHRSVSRIEFNAPGFRHAPEHRCDVRWPVIPDNQPVFILANEMGPEF